jgi:hypothetical protein
MRKKQSLRNSKAVGNDFESLILKMLDDAVVPYIQESTVTGSKKRVGGGVDIVTKNPICFFECKRYTKSLSFKLNSNEHDLKWSQIQLLMKKRNEGHLSGLLLQEESDSKIVFVEIMAFMLWYANNTRMSINSEISKKIGRVVDDMKWITEANE